MPERAIVLNTGGLLIDEAGASLEYEYFIPSAPAPAPYAAADYASEMLAHMPEGPIWSRDVDNDLSVVMRALAPTMQRVDARALALLREAPAGNLVALLPEWEATLGLPDPCAGLEPSIALRQASVRAAIAARGGQSILYFRQVAAALGINIAIAEYAPFRAGSRCGQPICGTDWAFSWTVSVSSLTVIPFLAGYGRAGEPLATWGSTVLECTLNRIRPAHTSLTFSYLVPSTGSAASSLGDFLLGRDVIV